MYTGLVLCFGFLCEFGKFRVATGNSLIIAPKMRDRAVRADFFAAFAVLKVSAASFTQRIQRAVAEQTIKIILGHTRMAGEKFTFPILKKCVVFIRPFGLLLRHPVRPLLHGLLLLQFTPLPRRCQPCINCINIHSPCTVFAETAQFFIPTTNFMHIFHEL